MGSCHIVLKVKAESMACAVRVKKSWGDRGMEVSLVRTPGVRILKQEPEPEQCEA